MKNNKVILEDVITYCDFCGEELKPGEDCWHIEGEGDYCYQDINNKKDVIMSCIGRELLRIGYTYEEIVDMFSKEVEERDLCVYWTEVSC